MTNTYVWTPAGTDITIRWRTQCGWVPPSELREYQLKWKYYQELPLRNLDELGRKAYEASLQKAKVARIK